MVLNAFIIDDETFHADLIESKLKEYCWNVKVIGKTNSPFDSIQEIIDKKPDLVFLDIEMPGLTGFELLECIPDMNFNVIFLTEKNHFAINAFNKNGIKYITKPVNIADLINAVNSFDQGIASRFFLGNNYDDLLQKIKDQQQIRIKVPTSTGEEEILPDDIVRVEATGSQSTIFFQHHNPLTIVKNLNEFEYLLDKEKFFKPHKSHIFNLSNINEHGFIYGNQIKMNDGKKIKVSKRLKNDFIKRVATFYN